MSQGTTPWGPTPAGPTPAGTTPESERDTEFQEHEKILSPDFLSVAQITDLLTEDVDGVQEKLRIFLNFKNLETCLKDAILLDYYVSGFLWARRMDFSVIQYSKFMTLLAMLLQNLKTLHMSLEDSIKWLGEVMAEIGPNHSQKSEEWSIFDVKQANAIIDYIKISLFQHYKLYEFMFYSAREEIVIGTERWDLIPLFRLESSGVIIAPCSLELLGPSDPSTSASHVAGTMDTQHHTWLIFYFMLFF
ncbi:ciliary-associated calcium-binding coiled-coil protein 1 isoform X3 [Aotus nancymaae]|uniref:ciliary-associated calcium-binding coiled-coil protein 1 isoform X3 n=1 Tax=Aotus nancymaae TaxID=37293 RepID=UPI0030FE25DB